jgi:hypothetical protein
MSKSENRCADCGGKLGLVSHHHWGLRFCRKACKDNFLAKSVQDHARMRKWFGFFARASYLPSIFRSRHGLSSILTGPDR